MVTGVIPISTEQIIRILLCVYKLELKDPGSSSRSTSSNNNNNQQHGRQDLMDNSMSGYSMIKYSYHIDA
ncbi:hypothetical protein M0804_011090 [Polistes exclamans]|nr:hypothetical protein M0804_011090 [Polistes exclamans]